MPGHQASAARRSQIIKAAYHMAGARGLDGVTVRGVAARAAVSPGLVLFHFESKEKLVLALLDWLLQTTTVLQVTPDILEITDPLDRLISLLRREMDRLASEPLRIRVFFDFWTRGIHNVSIRRKMRRELARYREAFRPIAAEVLRAEPERFAGVTPEGLAAVAVSFIKGCAVQSMIDTSRFDIAAYLSAAQALIGQPAVATA